uniref:ADF-H domain-containing protein n=1 Tax=Phaeocystis antarctica TaxID=33657 RepID=A0A7S0HIW0_9EUKA|mmetsp:Transcript_23576/g.56215  ORF Transcript_23576/g.56215 Transcript_23576/m.56215 type:complete len:138 (+) Transcript_23576:52-465(+)
MSSGVQVMPDCLTEFESMKIRSAYKFMIFKITDDKKHIEIEHKGEKGASFEDFTKLLPVEDCRYAVLDVEITTKSGATANKLIFVAWSDDNAAIKPKMLYASSKDAIKKALTGINDEFQATERGDLDMSEIVKKAGG